VFDGSGQVDASFGVAGSVNVSGYDPARPALDVYSTVGLAAVGNQLVVIGGVGREAPYSALQRFNADGSVDVGFGNGGVALVETNLSPLADPQLVAQPDGKLVVLGSGSGMHQVYRLTRDGQLDASFDDDGVALPQVETTAMIAPTPAGNVYVVGTRHTASRGDDIDIVRLLGDLSPSPAEGARISAPPAVVFGVEQLYTFSAVGPAGSATPFTFQVNWATARRLKLSTAIPRASRCRISTPPRGCTRWNS
jgi:uncharacterized delta-60 repeat protein